MNEQKTVLVTGATGLLGSRIVGKLLDESDYFVVALSRNAKKMYEAFEKYLNSGRLKCIPQDVCVPLDFCTLAESFGKQAVDAVFHAAGPIAGTVIRESPLDGIKPNIIATQNLMDALVAQRIKTGINGRIVLFSGGTVYGLRTDAVLDVRVMESDTVYASAIDSPLAPYSESKRMLEVIARAYVTQCGVDAVIARPSYLYGSTHFPPNTAIYEFMNQANLGQDITLNNSGFCKRDNIYIDDAIEGIFTIFKKGIAGEAYNISSGGELGNFAAIDEIAEMIVAASNARRTEKIRVIYNRPKIETRAAGIIYDNGKLKELGWKVETGIYDGINAFLFGNKRALAM